MSSSGQFARAFKASAAAAARCSRPRIRRQPARAIIAPLSVQIPPAKIQLGSLSSATQPAVRCSFGSRQHLGDDQAPMSRGAQGSPRLLCERIDYSLLEAARDIGAYLSSMVRPRKATRGGLQATETEHQARPIQHRARKTKRPLRPASARAARAAPPGYGSPNILAVLSKASPAASSSVSRESGIGL